MSLRVGARLVLTILVALLVVACVVRTEGAAIVSVPNVAPARVAHDQAAPAPPPPVAVAPVPPAPLPAVIPAGPATAPEVEPAGGGAAVSVQTGCARPWGECDDWEALAHWVDTEVVPIPEGRPEPLPWFGSRSPDAAAVARFRAPLPPVPVWNPPGRKRVALQAGHWQYFDAPEEYASLRTNPGSSGGGKAEWEVALDLANRAAAYLRDAGVDVDVMPVNIPVRYRAHLFLSIHGDGDASGRLNGYKLARPFFSGIPEVDDRLVDALYEEYGRVTGMPRDDLHISGRMRGYYAFNSRRYQHAVAPGVPQAIIEVGFMTSAVDRAMLIGDPDRPARGIAAGVLRFLQLDLRD